MWVSIDITSYWLASYISFPKTVLVKKPWNKCSLNYSRTILFSVEIPDPHVTVQRHFFHVSSHVHTVFEFFWMLPTSLSQTRKSKTPQTQEDVRKKPTGRVCYISTFPLCRTTHHKKNSWGDKNPWFLSTRTSDMSHAPPKKGHEPPRPRANSTSTNKNHPRVPGHGENQSWQKPT